MKFASLRTRLTAAIAVITVGLYFIVPALSLAASAKAIDRDARAALDKLYKHTPGAKALANKAVAVLVFPSIVKGGFIIAGQFGDGALRESGKSVAYYRSLAASYGFQAGVQAFGYVLFFRLKTVFCETVYQPRDQVFKKLRALCHVRSPTGG